MDQDTSGDQQTRAHLVRLYMELSQPQRDTMSELLRAAGAADVVGAQAASSSPAPSEPPAAAANAEALAARHLQLGQTQPTILAHMLRLPAAIIALGLATPEDADWSQRSPIP
ncbi:MAG TPA: hypothetical protein VGR88_00910 [Ktedonobacterales bacterium]|nr:hypothetical protein [Ktedonobacterales bacterium]